MKLWFKNVKTKLLIKKFKAYYMYIKYILYINIKKIFLKSIFNKNFNEYLTNTWPSQIIYFLVKGLAM